MHHKTRGRELVRLSTWDLEAQLSGWSCLGVGGKKLQRAHCRFSSGSLESLDCYRLKEALLGQSENWRWSPWATEWDTAWACGLGTVCPLYFLLGSACMGLDKSSDSLDVATPSFLVKLIMLELLLMWHRVIAYRVQEQENQKRQLCEELEQLKTPQDSREASCQTPALEEEVRKQGMGLIMLYFIKFYAINDCRPLLSPFLEKIFIYSLCA